jgi:hypothetical protein
MLLALDWISTASIKYNSIVAHIPKTILFGIDNIGVASIVRSIALISKKMKPPQTRKGGERIILLPPIQLHAAI